MRLLYRLYRKIKVYLLRHQPPVVTPLFFSLLGWAAKRVSERRKSRRLLWEENISRRVYFVKYKRENPPFVLRTENPVASESHDHRWPHGTLYDNSVNRLFNLKLYDLLKYKSDLKVLDMGCSGGGFVKSILDDGYEAVGVEGSDVSKKIQGGEWGTIPLHLFTCDITKSFSFMDESGRRLFFDVVTAWEVLEHMAKDDVPSLIRTVFENLNTGGYFIGSVDTLPDGNPNLGAIYHKTLEPRSWWLERFESVGFQAVKTHHFQTRDWVRGNGRGLKDWSPEDGDGFHLVLQKL
jgi:2-polyprenyl-3-methyl-5-hydroxy-6-metoxy-1,4-benzoquinol methylase